MITEAIKKLIEENPVALATEKNNIPNVSVAAHVKIKDNKIIITNNYMSTTLENIKLNNKISLVVWNKEWKGYQIAGNAEYFDNGKWFEFVKSLEENKNEPCIWAIVIKPEVIKKIG